MNAFANKKDFDGARHWFDILRVELKLTPDSITINSLLKAAVLGPSRIDWQAVVDYYQCFETLKLQPDEFTFGYLLMACKKVGRQEQAIEWKFSGSTNYWTCELNRLCSYAELCHKSYETNSSRSLLRERKELKRSAP